VQDSAVKPSTVYVLLALVVGFAVSDALLLVRLHRLNAEIASTVQVRKAATTPAIGQPVPQIQGTSLKDKQPSAVDPTSSPRLLLLVFRSGCHYCQANWENWDKLFGGSQQKLPVYMLTAEDALPTDFVDKHPLLKGVNVLTGVDQEIFQDLNSKTTPQTILVVDGKVAKVWEGVLSKQDVRNINQQL